MMLFDQSYPRRYELTVAEQRARKRSFLQEHGINSFEVRVLTAADMKRFRPAKEVPPGRLLAKLKVRGPQKTPPKERITIRLSPEVVQPFRATVEGWQTRVDAALKDCSNLTSRPKSEHQASQ